MKDAENDGSSMHCVDCDPVNPTQFIATGSSDGSYSVWDLRKENGVWKDFPIIKSQKHKGNVWQVGYHPADPNIRLTASSDGTALMWNFNAQRVFDRSSENYQVLGLLQSELSINCFDLHSDVNLLIAASDTEALMFTRLP